MRRERIIQQKDQYPPIEGRANVRRFIAYPCGRICCVWNCDFTKAEDFFLNALFQ